MTKIFILVLNYKKHQDTYACIASLKKSDLPSNSRIIILDNSEDNVSSDFLENKFPRLKLVKNKKNLGFAKANNLGIKLALKEKASHVLIINPDVVVPKNFFRPLLANLKTKEIGLVAPALKHKVKGKIFYGLDGYMEWLYAKPKHNSAKSLKQKEIIDAQFLTFACVLIKTGVFKSIGYLDERYFMYLEDVDFCLRAKQKGYKLYLDPQIIATHKTSASFSHPRHKLKISFISHLKFIQKWLPFPKNIPALIFQSLHYPYLYLLWSYHFWKYNR